MIHRVSHDILTENRCKSEAPVISLVQNCGLHERWVEKDFFFEVLIDAIVTVLKHFVLLT